MVLKINKKYIRYNILSQINKIFIWNNQTRNRKKDFKEIYEFKQIMTYFIELTRILFYSIINITLLFDLASGMLRQVILYSVIAIFIGISQSAGIGGGPVLNISLMIGGGYNAKESMSITYLFLMGGAFASLVKNYKREMPNRKSFVIDYNLVILTLPMIASGSIFGTLLNHFLSQLIITILFVILLTYLCVTTYKKLQKISKSQNESKKVPLMSQNFEMYSIGQSQNSQLNKILAQQLNPLPKDKLKLILFIFTFTIAILLIKGGTQYSSIIGINPCSYYATCLIFVHLGVSYYCVRIMANKIISIQNKKQQLGFTYDNAAQKMTQKKMRGCVMSGFAAGMIGGALGLGGAIVLVPVWLNSGINQIRASSSSSPLIFFSAIISFTICLLSDRYKSFTQLGFYFALAYLGSAMVKSFVQFVVEKYNLKTMIYILLLITMASSLLTLFPFQLYKFVTDPGDFMQFGQFC